MPRAYGHGEKYPHNDTEHGMASDPDHQASSTSYRYCEKAQRQVQLYHIPQDAHEITN